MIAFAVAAFGIAAMILMLWWYETKIDRDREEIYRSALGDVVREAQSARDPDEVFDAIERLRQASRNRC